MFALHVVRYSEISLEHFYHFISHEDSVKSQKSYDNDELENGYLMIINIHKNYKEEYRSGRFGKRTCCFLLSFFSPFFSLSTLSI